jgi:hypothetical protein
MKSFKQYISEASFKVNIPDMPSVYVDAKSAGEVKKKLRALLKKPMDVEVDRVPPSDVKKAFRLRAQGKDEDEVQEEAELGEARRGRPRKDGSSAQDSEGLENIQIQLRKSITLNGLKDVEFANGKKVKISVAVARKVLSRIDSIRQAKDKQNAVNYIMKSPENLNAFAAGKEGEMDPDVVRKKLLGIKEGYEEQSKEYHSKALASAKEIVSLIEKMGPYYGCKHLSRELEDMADRLENEIEMKDRETPVNTVTGGY